MQLKIFKSPWGMNGSLRENIEKIAAAGYAGLEDWLPSSANQPLFRELMAEYNLEYIAMVHSAGPDHADVFARQMEAVAKFNPVQITSHSAKDSMPFGEQVAFFAKAVEIEKQYGIPVGHETHRQRAMFTPWTTAALLREIPDLKIAADFSHWVCVCESLLADQTANLELAFERAIHIHGRVGFAEGPQVPHPGAPEYAQELAAHEGWWMQIMNRQVAAGAPFATFTPEFGPPGYMHTLPFTNTPVSDLWEVCLWMAKRFAAKWEQSAGL